MKVVLHILFLMFVAASPFVYMFVATTQMWVLLWLQVVSGSFDHYHVGSYSSEEACKEAQKEAKVLVTNQNSKVVCIKIER